MGKNEQLQNLNLTNIKKETKKFDEKIEITIGDKYKLKVDKVFRDSKINEGIAEAMKNLRETIDTDNDIQGIFTPYIMLIVMKHFTSLQIPDDLEMQIDVMKQLTDLGYFNEIISKIPTKELERFIGKVAEVTDNINQAMDQYEDDLEKVDLENVETENVAKNDNES